VERRAIIAGCPEYFKRGHKAGFYSKNGAGMEAGFYSKNGAGMGERRVPAYLEMYTFEAVGHLRLRFFCCGIKGIHCRQRR